MSYVSYHIRVDDAHAVPPSFRVDVVVDVVVDIVHLLSFCDVFLTPSVMFSLVSLDCILR